jgi:hypothetical protein
MGGNRPPGCCRRAAEDGDTLNDAERKAISEADHLKQIGGSSTNQPIPHEQVLAEFGLTMADREKIAHEPLPPDSCVETGS